VEDDAVAFWWKKKADPEGVDRGAEINRKAAELRRVAGKGAARWSDAVAALQTALGGEVAAEVLRSNPNFSPGQKLYAIDQILDGVCPGVREAAYDSADLSPSPRIDQDRDLSEQEFNDLATRIINEATKNNMPVGESLAATTKAVGLLIGILSERPGFSADDLVTSSQKAVAEFTREAISFRQNMTGS
jgi:hypothetical protein